MKANGYDSFIINESEQYNEMVDKFYASPIGNHLKSVENCDVESASGGQLLNCEAITEEIRNLVPGSILFQYGYLPVWSSIGGNALVYSINDKNFIGQTILVLAKKKILLFQSHMKHCHSVKKTY